MIYLYKNEFSFGIGFTDCAGSFIEPEDIYIGATPLNHVAEFSQSQFDELLGPHDRLVASAYLEESVFQGHPAICAEIHGGNMLGMRLREFSVK